MKTYFTESGLRVRELCIYDFCDPFCFLITGEAENCTCGGVRAFWEACVAALRDARGQAVAVTLKPGQVVSDEMLGRGRST